MLCNFAEGCLLRLLLGKSWIFSIILNITISSPASLASSASSAVHFPKIPAKLYLASDRCGKKENEIVFLFKPTIIEAKENFGRKSNEEKINKKGKPIPSGVCGELLERF